MVKRRFFLSITVGVSSVISASNGSIPSSIPAVCDVYLPIFLYAIGTYGAALLYHFSVYLVLLLKGKVLMKFYYLSFEQRPGTLIVYCYTVSALFVTRPP